MLCELCGKETARTTRVFIEGTTLNVCRECAKFGEVRKSSKKESTPPQTIITKRLEIREKRMKPKDLYESEEITLELVPDYPRIIREARMARDWKQETLAAKINEKVSVINKIERGDMRPDDALVKKLEKELGIKLMEKVPIIKTETKTSSSKGLTLGDIIKLKKE
ncbi:MAG: multiprotein bridging factor aMBF1 [Methanomassiliicoccales archaeon]|jgi:putative transcription factor|nr:multiprotein bridging factor aMBF1 [Methanomassiliicoccales archaeon]